MPEPPSGWAEGQTWEHDQTAKAEQEKFEKLDDIERLKKKSKAKVHGILGYLVPITIGVGFLIFWAAAGTYAWHVLAPDKWQWLKPDQIKELHTLLFSGVVATVMAQGARRYLD